MSTMSHGNQDIRSYEVVFAPFCLLCRSVVAKGLVKKYPSVINPVLNELVRRDISIIQMQCPELLLGGFTKGLRRSPKHKNNYDTLEFRQICHDISVHTTELLAALIDEGYKIRCVLGIEYSPSCAVNFIFKPHRSIGRTTHESGILIEELKQVLFSKNISIPFVGVNLRGMNKTLSDLKMVFENICEKQPTLF